MALATKCPHCNTTFRVAADQLKLRGGIVRCGTCKEVFDGNAALVDPAAALPFLPSAPPAAPAFTPEPVFTPAPAASTLHGDEPLYTLDFDTSFDPFGILPNAAHSPDIDLDLDICDTSTGTGEPVPTPMAPFKRRPIDEAPAFATYLRSSRPAEVDADETMSAPVILDKPAPAIEAPVTQPAPEPDPELAAEPEPEPMIIPAVHARQEPSFSGDIFEHSVPPGRIEPALAAEDAIIEEPAFVTQGRRREQSGKALHVAMVIGSVALLLLLVLQGMTTFRNPLAAKFPELKPALVALCSLNGCQVDLPAQIEALSIEQGELQTLAPDTFSYLSLLRNQGRSVQAWPSIELTLNDGNDKPVLRRVIAPRDYLPATIEVAKGFAPRSEQAIKLYFAVDPSTAPLAASGYHIAIFYP